MSVILSLSKDQFTPHERNARSFQPNSITAVILSQATPPSKDPRPAELIPAREGFVVPAEFSGV